LAEALNQQSSEQLGPEEGFDRPGVLGRDGRELQEALEPFEAELHLPAVAIELQELGGGGRFGGQAGQDEEELAGLKGAGVEVALLAASFLSSLGLSLADLLGLSAQRHDPRGQSGQVLARVGRQQHGEVPRLSLRQAAQLFQQVKGSPVRMSERQIAPGKAYQEVSSLLPEPEEGPALRVAAIRDHQVSALRSTALQALRPLGRGELQGTDGQGS
jgi:hypothetical protein